jgi:hypothetical protein
MNKLGFIRHYHVGRYDAGMVASERSVPLFLAKPFDFRGRENLFGMAF